MEYFILNEHHGDEALHFMRDHFYLKEPLNIAFGSETFWKRPYIKSVYVPSGTSLGAKHPVTKEMVGILLSSCVTNNEKITSYEIDTSQKGMKEFSLFMNYVDEKCDIFNKLELEKVLHIVAMATKSEFFGSGISSNLIKKAEELGKQQGCQASYGIALNSIAKKILKNLGYEIVYSFNCVNLVIDGVNIFQQELLPTDTYLEVLVKQLL